MAKMREMKRRRDRAVLLLLALVLFFARPAVSAAGEVGHAVVTAAIQNLYARPDETSPVETQAILGDAVDVLEETAGFARVRTEEGLVAWIPGGSLRRGPVEVPRRVAEVTSPLAHVYRDPSFISMRPLLTAPLGALVAAGEELSVNGYDWVRVTLPDGRGAYLSRGDVALHPSLERPAFRPDWYELGKRFLGAPYTWGGTTPAGFDCSGLVYRLLKLRGVLLLRNSSEQCFRDPKLVPVRFEDLAPGDLLFFGTEDKIDHEAIWLGDGLVLQATATGVPGTQITRFAESDRLHGRFRYARRLAMMPGAPKPGGLDARKLAALETRLKALAGDGTATYGIVFKDLSNGASIRLNERAVMHAASTMKTPVMLEVLRRVDEGTLKLTDEVEVRNEFRSALGGTPFSIELEPEPDSRVAPFLGKKAPLEFLVREMIVRSSNLATNIVLSLVTPQAVQKLCDAAGAATVKVRRCVEDTKAYEAGLNNETDAAGMAAVMETCVRSPKLSAAASQKAWEILSGQTLNEQIPAGVHPQSGAVVAHKTGSISTVQHDAAVVRLPDGREYVLVLLANGFGGTEEGRARVYATTRKMSRAVWDAMVAP